MHLKKLVLSRQHSSSNPPILLKTTCFAVRCLTRRRKLRTSPQTNNKYVKRCLCSSKRKEMGGWCCYWSPARLCTHTHTARNMQTRVWKELKSRGCVDATPLSGANLFRIRKPHPNNTRDVLCQESEDAEISGRLVYVFRIRTWGFGCGWKGNSNGKFCLGIRQMRRFPGFRCMRIENEMGSILCRKVLLVPIEINIGFIFV